MEQQSMVDILVIWRGKHMNVEINANANVREFGLKLQKLTRVRPDTMRLLVPQSSSKGSKLLHPFLDEHSSSTLGEAAILQGKPIRMMGAFNDEIEEVSLNSKMLDQRIAGFDEEEKRLRLRSERPHASLRLPQGAYIFCDFRTLHIPGVELNPQASEALKRMHMLACDPGIIAIMNKHRWRVGIMTEMAPEGYVGISPKCLLGFNKNYGEEISLRLRTDDLKGFRKYESVKKTLLHELAHMVYSDHDANFYALNKQLNQEATNLDWTKSKGNTLSGRKNSDHYEDELLVGSTSDNTGKTLGGQRSSLSTTARGSSVAAAYNRLLNASISSLEGSQVQESIHMDRMTEDAHFLSKKQIYNARIEPTSDNTEKKDKSDKSGKDIIEPDPDDVLVTVEDDMQVDMLVDITEKPLSTSSIKSEDVFEPDSDDVLVGGAMECFVEPDPDDLKDVEALESCEETDSKVAGLTKLDLYPGVVVEPDPDDFESVQSKCLFLEKTHKELDPVDSHVGEALECCGEPDPDDSRSKALDDGNVEMPQKEPDPDECVTLKSLSEPGAHMDPVDSRENENVNAEPDPDDSIVVINDQELRSIEESVSVICTRLHKAIEMLRSELTSIMVTSALQTLFKIIRNVLDHPDDVKFRRLRKANPLFQRNVVNYKAAMEFLAVVGFYEDLIADEAGRAETYLVLKRNDPGLLWLAKSSLEASLA